MGKQQKELVVEVKPFTLDGKAGWGITAGRKWHAYLYGDKQGAERYAGFLTTQQHIAVNVGYPSPIAFVGKAKAKEDE